MGTVVDPKRAGQCLAAAYALRAAPRAPLSAKHSRASALQLWTHGQTASHWLPLLLPVGLRLNLLGLRPTSPREHAAQPVRPPRQMPGKLVKRTRVFTADRRSMKQCLTRPFERRKDSDQRRRQYHETSYDQSEEMHGPESALDSGHRFDWWTHRWWTKWVHHCFSTGKAEFVVTVWGICRQGASEGRKKVEANRW